MIYAEHIFHLQEFWHKSINNLMGESCVQLLHQSFDRQSRTFVVRIPANYPHRAVCLFACLPACLLNVFKTNLELLVLSKGHDPNNASIVNLKMVAMLASMQHTTRHCPRLPLCGNRRVLASSLSTGKHLRVQGHLVQMGLHCVSGLAVFLLVPNILEWRSKYAVIYWPVEQASMQRTRPQGSLLLTGHV